MLPRQAHGGEFTNFIVRPRTKPNFFTIKYENFHFRTDVIQPVFGHGIVFSVNKNQWFDSPYCLTYYNFIMILLNVSQNDLSGV